MTKIQEKNKYMDYHKNNLRSKNSDSASYLETIIDNDNNETKKVKKLKVMKIILLQIYLKSQKFIKKILNCNSVAFLLKIE